MKSQSLIPFPSILNRGVFPIAAIVLLFTLLMAVVYAIAGDLDISFGNNGIVTTDFGTAYDSGSDVAIQADGKIVMVGRLGPSEDRDIVLARYNTNGNLDTNFGSGGAVITDLGGNDYGDSIAIQNDGKIIIAGSTWGNNGPNIVLVRYNINGSLDASFGSNGIVIGEGYGPTTAIQNDGKIVTAWSGSGSYGHDFIMTRYTSDGSLDTGFGNGGVVTTDFNSINDHNRALVIQNNGQIIAAGYTESSGNNNDFALARYNSDGSLDASFSGDGKVTIDLGGNDVGRGIAVQNDDKIIVIGNSSSGDNADIILVRYNVNGSLDTNFGSGGIVTTDSGNNDYGAATVIQPDNRIVVAGYSGTDGNLDFALVRYRNNGDLDTDFGTGGMVTTSISSDSDYGNAIALQSDGKFIVAGRSGNGGDNDFALVRYIGSPAVIEINYSNGGPGSYFTIIGSNFLPNSPITVSVNSHMLGTVSTDDDGNFTFLLSTTSADEGVYYLTASANSRSTVRFTLEADAPIRPQEGSAPTFDVPEGIIFTESIFLPIVLR